jgi:thiamine-phosphate diphosphorylase
VILCLVSDRRRFARPVPDLLEQVERAVDAGIDLIQVREPDLEAAALCDLVHRVLELTRRSATRAVVNDRLDVAIAAGAAGVHLRHDSVSVAAARSLMPPPCLIGRSVHTPEETGAAADADYLIAGTVFPTTSKPGRLELLGLDGLRAIVAASASPVLAIGGVTVGRLDAIAATGATGVAAIGLFSNLKQLGRLAELRERFDSLKPAS